MGNVNLDLAKATRRAIRSAIRMAKIYSKRKCQSDGGATVTTHFLDADILVETSKK